jgi:hypothetical protein
MKIEFSILKWLLGQNLGARPTRIVRAQPAFGPAATALAWPDMAQCDEVGPSAV